MHASNLELLEKSDLPPGQARAILQAVDTELVLRNYATKDDLKAQIEASEGRLLLAMGELKRELEVKIEAMGFRLVKWSFLFWISGIGILFSLFKWLK